MPQSPKGSCAYPGCPNLTDEKFCEDHIADNVRVRYDGCDPFQPVAVRTTIVCGPPGAGKTSFVRERARWGDLIVDVDALFEAFSGMNCYDKPTTLLPFVQEARNAVIRRLARPSRTRHAWIITGEADYSKLQAMKQQLGAKAEMVLMDVSASECMRRIFNDKRRQKRWEKWQPIVNKWWRTFRATGGRGL